MKEKDLVLFADNGIATTSSVARTKENLQRLDVGGEHREAILPYCRLRAGEIWEDGIRGHKVGLLDAASESDIVKLMAGDKAALAIDDPPYNVIVGNKKTRSLSKIQADCYIDFSRKWITNTRDSLKSEAHLYVWMGADYKDGFRPLPDFMIMMRDFPDFRARNLITMRNQRGFGTQKNWMWVRQELLYYTKGTPEFHVEAEYTDIPKILRGYYKRVNGSLTENMERSKSEFIRAGNVWVDIQQVFYRLQENVPGCYAQKPLKSIERILLSSSTENDLVVDFFSHAGTTLLAGEIHNRKVYTIDFDPVFAEITIRRLENYRKTGKTGWQWRNPFPEIDELDSENWV